MKEHLYKAIVPPTISIGEAISAMDKGGVGVLLVCDESQKLIGVITDGDIRRAILRNISFTESVMSIANKSPVIAGPDITPNAALHLMDHSLQFVINHLPVVNKTGKILELILRRDLIKEENIPLRAVIMAGGMGTRLRPLTEDVPKPMLPVGDRPLMEHIIEQLKKSGIHHVNISTHYKPEKIMAHFGNGDKFNVNINYIEEERPLGTAGALGFLKPPTETILVINGDIMTRVDFRAMLKFHRKHNADMTVGVRRLDINVPYGVLDCSGVNVKHIHEKPTYHVLVNAGLYLLEPAAHSLIPQDQRFDMTDLIQKLIKDGHLVINFPIIEYWLDIGQHHDYEKAKIDLKRGSLK